MKLIILNRAPLASSNGWIHIVPKGELPNREAGITQLLDDESLDSIIRNIDADKKRLGENWPGVYAGEEHFIYNDEKSSAAFAWFKDFEKRDNGIWAKDDGLTDLGAKAVNNKRFKFTSFVADRGDTQKLADGRVRILKIDTVGFTNQANGKELLTPITNRQTEFRRNDPADNDNNNQNNKRMKSVCTLLGLSADASEESVHQAVTLLRNRATTAEDKLTPLTNRATTLETENATLLTEQIEADFATHKITDEKVVNRHKPLLADLKHFKNRAERVEFIKDLTKAPANSRQEQTQLKNRDTRPPAAGAGENADKKKEQADANKIMNRAHAIMKETPNLSLPTAVRMAQTESENAS